MGVCFFFTEYIAPAEIHMLLPKGVDTAQCRSNPGFIGVINQDHARNVSAQHAHMIRRQCRSQSCNRIFNAVLVKHQQIKVSFNDIDRLSFPAFVLWKVKPIQRAAFVINRSFRGIKIFGQGIIHYPAPESDHCLININYGEYDTIPKTVIITASVLFR